MVSALSPFLYEEAPKVVAESMAVESRRAMLALNDNCSKDFAVVVVRIRSRAAQCGKCSNYSLWLKFRGISRLAGIFG